MTERSRAEVLADLLPIRRDAIGMAEHLNEHHGIRPEDRPITTPDNMDEATLRRYTRRLGFERFVEADVEEMRVWASGRQTVCSEEGCPGVHELMRMWGIAHERIEVLQLELPPDDPTGLPQTVRPEGLSTDVVTGWQQRYTG